MSTSNVSICNLALQKLGAQRITDLPDGSTNSIECNACFEHVRDTELRKNKWKFTLTRITLAPSATTPDHTYTYAFPLPSDCLRPLFPSRLGLDWKVENHEEVASILTNDGDTLMIRYVKRIADPTLFDPCFVEALACALAVQLCERLTQSNAKKEAAERAYAFAIRDARRMNAIEVGTQKQPVDEWLAARRTGQLINSEWGEE
jgi:hypothetical protein